MTLTCEICGRKFEAGRSRIRVHCGACAEELRRKGMGPVQVKRRVSAISTSNKVQIKEICWERAETSLTYYLNRFDRFPAYDSVMPPDLDQITDEDRRLANKIAARMSAETWSPIVGESIAQIGDWNLLNMGNLEWQSRKEVIHGVLSPLLTHSGIGIARLTKALHRKRPKLIPVCDNVVIGALGVEPSNKIDRLIECMERFRVVGRKHLSSLAELRRRSRQFGSEMTELRILELLYWVQFGPFPLKRC